LPNADWNLAALKKVWNRALENRFLELLNYKLE